MPSFLPNEILQHIFSFLQPTLRRKGHGYAFDNVVPLDLEEASARQLTLLHILLTSKLFQKLALPFLYHTLPITSGKLLATLAQSADLAKLVKAIDLSTTGCVDASSLRNALDAARSRLSLSATFEQHLQHAIDGVGSNLTNTGAEAVLYLILLKNLETLEYRGNIGTNAIVTEFFGGATAAAVAAAHEGEGTQVPRLSELRLRHWDGRNTTPIAEVQQLLVGSIEKLHGCGINWEVSPLNGAGRPSFMAAQLNLKHIEKVDVAINGYGLDDMLRRCPDLRTLRIVWGNPSRMPTFPLDFGTMGAALRRHARGLEKLTLDCLVDLSYTQGHSEGIIGSLRELTSLVSLVVAQDVLVGEEEEGESFRLDQVLPDSLQTLQLLTCQDDEEDLDEQITSFIQGGRLANLRRIQMKRHEDFSGDAAELGWRLWHRWDKMILTKL